MFENAITEKNKTKQKNPQQKKHHPPTKPAIKLLWKLDQNQVFPLHKVWKLIVPNIKKIYSSQ